MDFTLGLNLNPGYYNLSEQSWETLSIKDSLENLTHLGLYLADGNYTDEEWEKYIPFPNNLESIHCEENKFTQLPELPNNLIFLYCQNNELIQLPQLPNNLRRLKCENNKLIQIPELPNTLQDLHCESNLLERLPQLPETLVYLNCENNLLNQIPPFPNGIIGLFVNNNNLTSLPPLPVSLVGLHCSNNKLTSLPPLPVSLVNLVCTNNKLNTLPELPNSLRDLQCRGNDFDVITIDRIILWYQYSIFRNTITFGHQNNHLLHQFQTELGHFIELKNLKKSQSVSVVHSLTTGRLVNEEGELKEKENKKLIPKGLIGKINEYANLNIPDNAFGGKRQNKKKTNRKRNTKKSKKSKKTKKSKKK